MERTVTIPLSEYEHLKRVNGELQVEVRRANEAAGKWLDKLGEIAQIVAFLTSDDDEDESEDEDGCDNPSGVPFSEWLTGLSKAGSRYEDFVPASRSASVTCPIPTVSTILYNPCGSH